LDDLVIYARPDAGDPVNLQDVFVYYNDGNGFSAINGAFPDLTGLWGSTDDILFGEFTPAAPVSVSPTGLAGPLGEFHFSWDSFADCLYAVECATNLSSAVWTQVGTVNGNGGTVTFTNTPATNGNAFYRVRIDAAQFVY
jgi:hypothetical protein